MLKTLRTSCCFKVPVVTLAEQMVCNSDEISERPYSVEIQTEDLNSPVLYILAQGFVGCLPYLGFGTQSTIYFFATLSTFLMNGIYFDDQFTVSNGEVSCFSTAAFFFISQNLCDSANVSATCLTKIFVCYAGETQS